MRIELIQTEDGLEGIRASWNRLLSASESRDLFLCPEWLLTWWRTIATPDRSLHFVAMWEEDQLRALFPLQIARLLGVRCLCFAGCPRHVDRMDFLIEPGAEDECFAAFADWLFTRRDWDIVVLRCFAPLTSNHDRLQAVLEKGRRRYLCGEDMPSLYSPLYDFADFADYMLKAHSARTRNLYRRMGRKLGERGHVEWARLDSVDDKLIQEMSELDRKRSIRGESGDSFFSEPLNEGFLRELSNQFKTAGGLNVFACRLDGRLCAFYLMFLYDERALCYQTAFDSEFTDLKLGTQAMLEALRYATDQSATEFDLLSGDEGYKARWTTEQHATTRMMIYRRGIRSWLMYLYHRWLKPARRKMGKSFLCQPRPRIHPRQTRRLTTRRVTSIPLSRTAPIATTRPDSPTRAAVRRTRTQ